VREFLRRGHRVRALSSQRLEFNSGSEVECIQVPHWRGSRLPIDVGTLAGVDVIIHLAGRAHVIKESAPDPLKEFHDVNVAPTVALAQLAIQAQTPKLIFASSIGVNGNTTSGAPFTEDREAAPLGHYAASKWEAERELTALSRGKRLTVVRVRLPLVYGPEVRGNFLRLLKLISTGLPLPLGAVHNMRSYLGLRNACDFLAVCAERADAQGLFLVSDGEDISTPDLIIALANAMRKRARLVRVPVAALEVLARLLALGPEVERLTSSLRVDSTHARQALNWHPSTELYTGLSEMARWHLNQAE
jgi:UDP-4-keto-D-FucNAc 4-reductase